MLADCSGLLPHQIPAAEHLIQVLERNGGALDASDMGVGKTYTAGAVLRHYRALPSVVVCPAISIPAWQRMGNQLGVEFELQSYEALRTGTTGLASWENPKPPGPLPVRLNCNFCQLDIDCKSARCAYAPGGVHCVESKKIPHKYGKLLWHPSIKLVVFDEAHRCSATNTLQSELAISAKRQRIRTLLLSATPAQTPLGMKAIGYILGLHTLVGSKGFYPWAMRNGCQRMPWGGFDFALGDDRKKEVMANINRQIFPDRGVRITIQSLGKSFPESQVTSELYDIASDAAKLDRLYRQMEQPLQELQQAKLLDKDPEGPLTKLLRLREEIGLVKVPVLAELAEDALQQGLSVACFVNFHSEADALSDILKTECCVTGRENPSTRNARIAQFQANRSRVIVTTIKASISLHDELGGHPRIGFVSPGFSALDFRQVLGRLPRSGSKSKAIYRIIFAANTCEERIHAVLTSKLNNLDALTDGDLFANNLELTSFSDQLLSRKSATISTLYHACQD